MDAEEFEAWKERERETARDFEAPSEPSISGLQRFYPEWDFSGMHTTSLEPYTPLWIQLPFYDRVNVGVNLRLDSIEEFEDTYGLFPGELLDLYNNGQINLRLLYPLSDINPANFYEPLIEADLPSSMRDWKFTEKVLGTSEFNDLENHFRSLTSYQDISSPLDNVGEDPDRAQQNMWAVYAQLRALGYDRQADYFEKIVRENKDRARTWMEVCRQFLIGPVHYSFGGVHSVSAQNPVVGSDTRSGETLPTEIGQVLVDKLDLVEREWEPGLESVEEALAVYDDYEQARDALWNLKSAVEAQDPADIDESRKQAAEIIDQAVDTHQRLVRAIRMLAATGIGAIGIAQPYAGFLATLGYSVAEFASEGAASEKLATGVEKQFRSPHLVSIMGLWQDSN